MNFLRIMGLLLLLVAMSFVPAHNSMASSNASMMMATADGSPCPPEDCDAMAGCTMALASGFSSFACLIQDVAASDRFDVSSVDFDLAQVKSVAMFDGDGLRRPPKI